MSLKVNFSLMTAGRGLYVVCQWLLLVVIARLADPAALGQFTYALALTSPIIIFTQFNMRAYMATDTQREFAFADYRNARALGVILSGLVIAGVALARGHSGAALWVIVFVGMYKAVESLSDIYFGVLQKNEVFRPIATSLAAHGLLAVSAVALALWLTGDLRVAAGGVFALWLAMLVFYDRPAAAEVIRADAHAGPTSGSALAAIRACFPFGLTLTLMSLCMNVPVYFIEARLGVEAVGYYSAVAYFIVAGRLVIGSLMQASSPRLAKLFNAPDAAGFRRLLARLVLLTAALAAASVLAAALLGRYVLYVAYGADYATLDSLFIWIMVAAGAGYFAQLTGTCLTVARARRMLVVSYVLGTATVVASCALLIPSGGLIGGAIALLLGTLVIVTVNGLTMAHIARGRFST